MKNKTIVDLTQEDDGTIIDKSRVSTWTIQDEAIHRGFNYSEDKYEGTQELMREGVSLKAVLKNAYQEGFLHGFEHKFDNTNYEEK